MIRAAAGLVMALGALLLVQGAWIPAKAALAQVLLEGAWQRARGGAAAPRPWSWADMTPVARLRIPAHGYSAIVLDGATGASLAFGPGLLHGTAHPGAPGHSVVFGHRDTHFALLEDLVEGDLLEIERRDGTRVLYRVGHRAVIHETQREFVAAGGPDRLSLVTCYPFDDALPGGPLRFLVTAERVDPRPGEMARNVPVRSH